MSADKRDGTRFAFKLRFDEHPILAYIEDLQGHGARPREIIRLAEIGRLALNDAEFCAKLSDLFSKDSVNQAQAFPSVPNRVQMPEREFAPSQFNHQPMASYQPQRSAKQELLDSMLEDLEQTGAQFQNKQLDSPEKSSFEPAVTPDPSALNKVAIEQEPQQQQEDRAHDQTDKDATATARPRTRAKLSGSFLA